MLNKKFIRDYVKKKNMEYPVKSHFLSKHLTLQNNYLP